MKPKAIFFGNGVLAEAVLGGVADFFEILMIVRKKED